MIQELGHLKLDPKVHADESGCDDGAKSIDDDQVDVDDLDGIGQPYCIGNHHGQQKVVAQLCKLLILFVGRLVAVNECGQGRNQSNDRGQLS